MVSKFQWKPFWLATQRDPQNDWTATKNRVNYDVFAQAPLTDHKYPAVTAERSPLVLRISPSTCSTWRSSRDSPLRVVVETQSRALCELTAKSLLRAACLTRGGRVWKAKKWTRKHNREHWRQKRETFQPSRETFKMSLRIMQPGHIMCVAKHGIVPKYVPFDCMSGKYDISNRLWSLDHTRLGWCDRETKTCLARALIGQCLGNHHVTCQKIKLLSAQKM